MNTLSWLIYAVNIVGRLDFLLFMFVMFFTIFVVLLSLVATVGIDDEECVKIIQRVGGVRPYIFLWLTLILLTVALPSKQTIVLIAASEYGEKVLNNPKVTEIVDPSLDVLKLWIEKEKKALSEDLKR